MCIDIGLNRKRLCDFLLIISSNFGRISYRFYRAMHFSAKRGLAIASVRPSVCLSVVDCDHIGWNSSKIISRLVSIGRSLSADPNIRGLLEGEQPEI